MAIVEESLKVTMAVLIAYNCVSRIMERGGMYVCVVCGILIGSSFNRESRESQRALIVSATRHHTIAISYLDMREKNTKNTLRMKTVF